MSGFLSLSGVSYPWDNNEYFMDRTKNPPKEQFDVNPFSDTKGVERGEIDSGLIDNFRSRLTMGADFLQDSGVSDIREFVEYSKCSKEEKLAARKLIAIFYSKAPFDSLDTIKELMTGSLPRNVLDRGHVLMGIYYFKTERYQEALDALAEIKNPSVCTFYLQGLSAHMLKDLNNEKKYLLCCRKWLASTTLIMREMRSACFKRLEEIKIEESFKDSCMELGIIKDLTEREEISDTESLSSDSSEEAWVSLNERAAMLNGVYPSLADSTSESDSEPDIF